MKKEVGSLQHLHVSPTEGNVALYKPVTGIGLVGDGVNTYPFLVDGDSGTCADSGTLVFDPALQIDLGEEYFVEGVKLVFAPTCAVSISGHGCYYKHTTVHVGNDRHHPDHDECVHLQNIPGESRGEIVLHYSPGPVRGRYVTLKKEEDMVRAIYLCELQVFGEPVQKGQSSGFLQVNENGDNVAFNKLVSGINLVGDGKDTYQLLVDGNTQTCADSGSLVVGPAFTVDLGGEYLIEAVKLTYASTCETSMTGYGCYFHTTVIEVSGGDISPEVKDCSHLEEDEGVEAKGEAYLGCTPGPMVGRYVTIRKETTSGRAIYLCELKVIGMFLKPSKE
ncbi:uncharacterized protein [Ptychodera flava]|uniref:uncharacterized protein n=1 Tax=Ptychodera flava TaxID=63121 RepID=UPI003969BFEC